MARWGNPLGVRFDARPALDLTRNLRGQFTSAQAQVHAAHREAADLAAEQFAKVLEEKVEARAARTGFAPRETAHLRKALRDPRNAPADITRFGAGNPSWLDRSPARPYWRNLNYGTTQFVGTPVFVFANRASSEETGIRDARNSAHRWRGTLVQNPIEAYQFMEEGAQRAENVIALQMRSIYRRHIPNFYRLFTERYGPSAPGGGVSRF